MTFKNSIFNAHTAQPLKFVLYITGFLLFALNVLRAQVANTDFVAETPLTIQSIDRSFNPFEGKTEYAFMILNLTNGDFLLQTDAARLETGNNKLDSILQSKGSQIISFKGNATANLFLFNKPNSEEKLYDMPGQLFINNFSINCVAQFNPLNYSEKPDQQSYRMDFRLSVDPGKLFIYGLESKINKQITITIKGGKLNTRQ